MLYTKEKKGTGMMQFFSEKPAARKSMCTCVTVLVVI